MNNKCNLELAKRLKELGVKQESEFYWCNWIAHSEGDTSWEMDEFILFENYRIGDLKEYHNELPESCEIYSAFIVGELGEILPDHIHSYRLSDRRGRHWICSGMSKSIPGIGADTEANARTKMLIYLLENKLITVEEVNETIRNYKTQKS